jgi:hypothetical protein
VLFSISLVWLACAAIFLELADHAPVLEDCPVATRATN